MCSIEDSGADGDGGRRSELRRALDGARALLAAHADAALFGVTDDELVKIVESREALTRIVDAIDLGVVREVDGRGVGRRDGAAGTALWMRDRLKIRPRQAQARVRLAAALDGQLTATRHALTDTVISADHAAVIVSVVGRLPRHRSTPDIRDRVETVLLRVARTVDPGDLAKVGRALLLTLDPNHGDDDAAKRGRRTLSMREREDGMTALHAVLDPEGAAIVTAALDPLAAPKPVTDGQRDPRPAGRRRCDALIELCRTVMNHARLPTTGGERPHVSVLVPFSTLTGAHLEPFGPFGFRGRYGPGGPNGDPSGAGDPGEAGAGPGRSGLADGGPAYTIHGGMPLPKGVTDRIVCDASVRRIVFGPKGEPLDVGRTARTTNAAIRAAVAVRDQICTFPSCDRPPSWDEYHHLVYWNAGGETAVANVALACGFHHDVAHYDGWDLRLGPEGRIQWRAPPSIDPDQTWRTNHIRTARDPYTLHQPDPDP